MIIPLCSYIIDACFMEVSTYRDVVRRTYIFLASSKNNENNRTKEIFNNSVSAFEREESAIAL